MMSMTGTRPFASHFKYSFTVTEERTVLVPEGPTKVVLGEDVEPADSRYSSTSKEHYPHMEEADSEGREYKPVDAPNAEASRHVEKKQMDVKIQKTRYDAGSYELLLTLLRTGELSHYGFETSAGPNIASARSVVEFLSERVELPYRKDGETKTKTFGPLVEEMPSEAEMQAMQMLFNGHRRASSSGMNPERVLQIVEAVVERDMETLDGLVQELMEPFMETETVKVPAEDGDGMMTVEQPMPEERDRVKNEFALTLEGINA